MIDTISEQISTIVFAVIAIVVLTMIIKYVWGFYKKK